jgi:hypothetical protein
MVWMDATGKQVPLISRPGGYRNPRLSPDGKRVAYMAPGSKGLDLWIHDVERDITSQLTFSGSGACLGARCTPHRVRIGVSTRALVDASGRLAGA